MKVGQVKEEGAGRIFALNKSLIVMVVVFASRSSIRRGAARTGGQNLLLLHCFKRALKLGLLVHDIPAKKYGTTTRECACLRSCHSVRKTIHRSLCALAYTRVRAHTHKYIRIWDKMKARLAWLVLAALTASHTHTHTHTHIH